MQNFETRTCYITSVPFTRKPKISQSEEWENVPTVFQGLLAPVALLVVCVRQCIAVRVYRVPGWAVSIARVAFGVSSFQ
jgi:hypothetical protein